MQKGSTLTKLYERGGLATYPCDKAHYHKYLPFYDLLFKPYKYLPINIFEIGYLDGGSVRLWEDYFPNAQIRAIDITDHWRRTNGVDPRTDRVKLELRDSMTLTSDYFKDFLPDIVIDDGCHISTYQTHVVKVVYPILRAGGLLIIEDFGSPEKLLGEFTKLGYPFDVMDLRCLNGFHDNMLLIYHK
jgi:hypothetical protein